VQYDLNYVESAAKPKPTNPVILHGDEADIDSWVKWVLFLFSALWLLVSEEIQLEEKCAVAVHTDDYSGPRGAVGCVSVCPE